MSAHSRTLRTDALTLRDVTDDGQLVVSYDRIEDTTNGDSFGTHKSLRLPVECMVALDGGHTPLADLSDEERAWIEAESGTTLEAAR